MNFEQNFFTLLQLPQQFAVDDAQLAASHRALQRQYHPDRYVNAVPQEQRLAVQFSAHLNTAMATLKNPVQRALHLLSLAGIDIDCQQRTIADGEFLLRQMAFRESLDAALADDDRGAMTQLVAEVAAQFDHCQTVFSQQFADVCKRSIDLPVIDAADDFAALLDTVEKMQFFEKLHAEVQRMLPV